jgi:hypothetical protein
LVMKPNLSHSLPVTTPFKKYVFSTMFSLFPCRCSELTYH